MMRRSRWSALLLGAGAATVLSACVGLTTTTEEDDDDALALSALQCRAMFQGSEYQNLVAQFEAQEAEARREATEIATQGAAEDDPLAPRLYLGEVTETCYLNEKDCRADGNRFCAIVARARIFGLPSDSGGGAVINPASAALGVTAAATAAAVAVGVAVGVSGGGSSTTSTN